MTTPYSPPAITREGTPSDFGLFVCSGCGELFTRGESHANVSGQDVCLPCFEKRRDEHA